MKWHAGILTRNQLKFYVPYDNIRDLPNHHCDLYSERSGTHITRVTRFSLVFVLDDFPEKAACRRGHCHLNTMRGVLHQRPISSRAQSASGLFSLLHGIPLPHVPPTLIIEFHHCITQKMMDTNHFSPQKLGLADCRYVYWQVSSTLLVRGVGVSTMQSNDEGNSAD
jgi:hypothetical protein